MPPALSESSDIETDATGPDDVRALWQHLRRRLVLLLVLPVVCGAVALGATYLVTPVFTAITSFLPPQQQQSASASVLQSLGALAGLAGAGGGARTPADQYVSLMQSTTVSDRIIDRFKLLQVYEARLRMDGRKELAKNVRITVGKKDGLITLEVDDTDPQRAADMANRYVEELRVITAAMSLTEAQQRRAFFEKQLNETKERLVVAQQDLEGSGFNPGALKAEPKSAAEGYARLKAEVTGAEVRLQALRGNLSDNTSEVRQQLAIVGALRAQLARLEQPAVRNSEPGYVGRFREFKYQEALFEIYARQYELARVDESREGSLIQVVDPATAPEKKSRPKRGSIAMIATASVFALTVLVLLLRGPQRRRLPT